MGTNGIIRISAALLLSAAAFVATAAPRTYVASYGLETNPCTRAAPCRTLQRAHNLTDSGGELIVLDSEGYGRLEVKRSISVIAPEGVHAGVNVLPAAHGIVINDPDAVTDLKVVLRGLAIHGFGGQDGIRIEDAAEVYIERVTISNTGLGAAIRVANTAFGVRLYVTDTTIRGNKGTGIKLDGNAFVLVDRCRIEGHDNGAGIQALAPNGMLTVTDSVVARNAGGISVAIFPSGTGVFDLNVARSVILHNAQTGINVGGIAGTGPRYDISITDNIVEHNGAGGIHLGLSAGQIGYALVGNNRVTHNGSGGIWCSGDGAGRLIAERNEVKGNSTGLLQAGNCIFKSLGNNTVEYNDTDVSGVINPATSR